MRGLAILILLLCALASGAWRNGSAGSGPANPTSYNTITNHSTYTGAPPALGAAGTTTHDPDFGPAGIGTAVMRVTQAGSCGTGATNGFYANEGIGWQRSFNSNDTAILFYSDYNGVSWWVQPVTLNGSTMSLNGSCISIPFGAPTTMDFSAVHSNLIYGLSGNYFSSWDWTTHPGSPTHLVNLATIPGFTLTSPYLSECDDNDAWCATSNNVQNYGQQAAFYNLQTGHTMVFNFYNSSLGTPSVQIDSGTPVSTDAVITNQLSACYIHSIVMSRDGTWAEFVPDDAGSNGGCTGLRALMSGSGPNSELFWQIGTNHLQFMTDSYATGGHEAMGSGSIYTNIPGPSDGGCYMAEGKTLWNANNPGGGVNAGYWIGIDQCQTSWWTFGGWSHETWMNNHIDSYVNEYPTVIQFRPATISSTPYNDELVAVQMSNAYTRLNAGGPYRTWATSPSPLIWRVMHQYNDTDGASGGYCIQHYWNSPNVSPDGKYVTIETDWRGATGPGPCTKLNNYLGTNVGNRTDVFIVALPQ